MITVMYMHLTTKITYKGDAFNDFLEYYCTTDVYCDYF